MRKVLRWTGIVALSLVGLVLLGILTAYVVTRRAMNRTFDVTPAAVAIPTDAAAVSEGARLYLARGCGECHDRDLGGKAAINDPGLGLIYAPNITRGRGSVTASYSDADWVRTIRHGVKPDHRSVVMMPSQEFYHLSDRELGMIIAYAKSVPPVDRDRQLDHFGIVTYVVSALGLLPLLPATMIPHNAARTTEPTIGVTPEYGKHLASIQCIGCHGEHFSGGPIPGAPPSLPVPKNLTPDATGLAKWSKDDFVKLLRTGTRPDGTAVNPFMPWQVYSNLNDTELAALWAFFQSLPPRPFGKR